MKNSRVLYLDILNVIAVIAVMFMHCNGYSYDFMELDAWKYAVLVEVLCCFCVPIFLMITGATVMDYRKKYDTKTFYLKRIPKLILPWLISFFVAGIILVGSFDFQIFLTIFFDYKILIIYWFPPMIITIYLLIPFLSILIEKVEYKKLLYGLGIYIFIVKFVVVTILNIFNISLPSTLEYFNMINPYLLYVILGYCLFNECDKIFAKKKNRIILYTISISLMLCKGIYIIYCSIQSGTINRDLLGYLDFMTVFYSASVFIFFKYFNIKNEIAKKISPIVSWLAKRSYLIYVTHYIVILFFKELLHVEVTTWFYRMVLPIIVYFLTILIIYIIGISKELFIEETDN